MMINDVQLRPHATWWKAPLAASIPGLPLLVWQFLTFWGDGYTSGIEAMSLTSLVLLAVSWLLPHRRSQREWRMVAAGTALAMALLPVVQMILMVAAMASA
ncbi:hypothetical protein RCO28_08865 [Streptomyces sp. LHD-70]|uniref:hypothetical protein n=1 Tax=Streptomyces sp. LHD-70 TaxID=3072140 RepID=UPI00280EE4E2|nr:hypothetical protein [Streptomyces sp. LHD-70]MDQ8702598.1 hypothetical protein [Streptomyces sp. LHD-70]